MKEQTQEKPIEYTGMYEDYIYWFIDENGEIWNENEHAIKLLE